jgi:hypothetical protein
MNKSPGSLKVVTTHSPEAVGTTAVTLSSVPNSRGDLNCTMQLLIIDVVSFSLIKPHKYNVKRKHCPHGPIATITNDSQVKTYMDNSNGVRNINSNAYNKVRGEDRVFLLDGIFPAVPRT